jgi:hypothetical protein
MPNLKPEKLAALVVFLAAVAVLLAEAFGHLSLAISGVPGDPGVYLLVIGLALFTGQPPTAAELTAFDSKWIELVDTFKPILEGIVAQVAHSASTPAPTATPVVVTPPAPTAAASPPTLVLTPPAKTPASSK